MSGALTPAKLLLLVLACAASSPAAEWFVAPDGDDAAPGSLDHPFASVRRAQNAAAAGDTVFLRGGCYRMSEADIALRKGIFASVVVLDKSGEPGRPITYRAFPPEQPVFDFRDVRPKDQRVAAFHVTGSWLHLSGIEVTGVQVTIPTHTQSICFESNGSHNVFERLAMHDGQAIGIYHVRGSDNLFLNCDAWNNWDSTSDGGRGGNVDGFGCHPTQGSTGNVFRGCRAWFNSDDGFDLIGAREPVTLEQCWAFANGFSPQFERRADGNGFKAGGYAYRPASELPTPVPRHTIRFCLAVSNKANGFYANHHPGGNDWFHNTAYRNGVNFNMLGRLADPPTDVDGYGHTLRNNLSHKARSKKEIDKLDGSKSDVSHNSFDRTLTVSDADFMSLDETELLRPRQLDGELPAIEFLRPSRRSVAVDRGVDLGFPFAGSAPDLGAFES